MDSSGWCLVSVFCGIIAFICFAYLIYEHKRKIKEKEQRYKSRYSCPFCEHKYSYLKEALPKKIICEACNNKFLLYEGQIEIRGGSNNQIVIREIKGLKTKSLQSSNKIIKSVYKDKRINIQDSVIQRSNVGNVEALNEKQPNFCVECGEHLGKENKFCPECGNAINASRNNVDWSE